MKSTTKNRTANRSTGSLKAKGLAPSVSEAIKPEGMKANTTGTMPSYLLPPSVSAPWQAIRWTRHLAPAAACSECWPGLEMGIRNASLVFRGAFVMSGLFRAAVTLARPR